MPIPSEPFAAVYEDRNRLGVTMTFATNTRAREEQADHYFQEIIDIADNATPETANVARLRVDSRKFAVACLAPKKYGDHVEHEHSGSSQHLVAVVNLLGAPDDASLPLPQKPAIKHPPTCYPRVVRGT